MRINAEDPSGGRFSPSPGTLTSFHQPSGPGVRLDAGYETGDTVSQYYDNLIAKLIVWAPDREAARRRMLRAIAETRITGVATTLPADVAILSHPDFAAATHSTKWVEETLDLSGLAAERPAAAPAAAGEDEVPTVERDVTAEVDGRRYSVRLWVPDLGPAAGAGPGGRTAQAGGRLRRVAGTGSGQVTVPMQGTIVKVLVAVGDVVEVGPDHLPARGHEDGERRGRREGRGDQGAARQRGRLRRRRRHRGGHRVGGRPTTARRRKPPPRSSTATSTTWSRSATSSTSTPSSATARRSRPTPWPRPCGPAASRSRRASTTCRPRSSRGPATGDLIVAVCAEYDALPEVGHACGHNIIAATAVGAGLALAAVADDLGLTVRVLGTPAEEGGGGKVLMLERGAFAGVHAAMMVHPWPTERLTATCLAVAHFDVHFAGREAHASAAPWEGVNAQDALTVAQVAIGLLRQQLPPGDQVHGVVTESPGAANVIPGAITARYMVRSRTADGLAALRPAGRGLLRGGRARHRLPVEYEELSPVYSHMEPDPGLLGAYRANAEALGRRFEADDAGTPLPTFSTDMANVSLAVPTIHPLIGIEANGAVNHQREFAAACVTPSADAAVRDGARGAGLDGHRRRHRSGPARRRLLARP